MSGPLLAATICRTLSGQYEPLAKRITLDGAGGFTVRGYDHATWYTFEQFTAPGIVPFGRRLLLLANDPAAAVLRGAPLPHVRPGGCYHRRFTHADPATNAIEEVARAWIAVDCDDIPAPETLANWLHDIPRAARYLIGLLPTELHDVSCAVQVTGSAGFSGDNLLRLRLWFALDQEIDCAAIKRWAKAWNNAQGTRLIDWSIFTPVALNYTADPILGPGVRSPLVARWCMVRQRQERATLQLPPEPVTAADAASPTGTGVNAGSGTGAARRRSFSELVMLIGSVEHGFYEPIKSALGRGAADEQDRTLTITAVRAAVLAADPGHRDQATIGRYADREFLGRAFDAFSRQDGRLRETNEQTYRHWFRQHQQRQTGGTSR